jgi:hypothetical protein
MEILRKLFTVIREEAKKNHKRTRPGTTQLSQHLLKK